MKNFDQNWEQQRNSASKTSNFLFLEISRDITEFYLWEYLSEDSESGVEQWFKDWVLSFDLFQLTPLSYFSFLFIFNLNVCLTEVLKMSQK